ncbi:LysR family transcriptional regulator [Pseudomonas weihenstephanensis]|mgnify:CR=1 FL=1|uniref:LysR family transcriptional regulator n=1 Tax=Pseudomonas weihenstephanensis TaxID=1608994 RepID=A0A0J6IL69_9PSED|nr:LysR family transcriptional regulator [Pseudomonas weihenstephanensis]KMN12534.1 LysR family transcriptional regulator [Pseudomonas weihenstephanensis]KMN20519.1 LysR family transcriptional regulator [Pseudomonas weihenstephanensis]MBM1189550.1 LysR family transcriptional regulator [Pseudomonas weihenstephanensis]GLX90601.1 transcriptional regulator [Pseudomonas fragi]
MHIPDMNLLVALNVLLEEGSVVGAARRMNLSAPAMSRTLTRIREALNDPILVRSGRGLVPTPRALELREQVRGVVELAHGVFTQSQDSDLRLLDRTFSIRANDVFFGVYGGALRQQMALEMPNAALRVVPEGFTDDEALNEGRIDLAISATHHFSADIKVQQLFSCPFVGLAREGHPIFEQAMTPQRFAGFDHISVSRRGRARGPIDAVLAELNLERRVLFTTPTFYSAIFALADSDLILPLMPQLLLRTLEPLGLKLKAFELPIALQPVEICQAWHPRLDNDHAHRWLRRTLKNLCDHASV